MSGITVVEPGRVYNTWARALYDFDDGHEENLKMKRGDVIEVTNKLETGWWNGSLDGHSRGWFPALYVETCKSPLPPEEGKVLHVWARALRDYEGVGKEWNGFKKGDRIGVTHKLEDGRWRGTVDGASSGWFPSSYVESCEGPVIVERKLERERYVKM